MKTGAKLGWSALLALGSTASDLAVSGNLELDGLGLSPGTSIFDSGDPDLALFTNLDGGEQGGFWSETLVPDLSPAFAYYFGFVGSSSLAAGVQSAGPIDLYTNTWVPWAVRSGDVGVIPVPASIWLFGSAIMGLLGFRKRFR